MVAGLATDHLSFVVGISVYHTTPTLPPARLNRHAVAVVRTPYASYALVDTLDRLVHPLDLLAAGVPEVLRPLKNFGGLHVLYADISLTTVDVLADNDGVFPWSGGDDDLDLWMRGRELWKKGLDEGARKPL
jgi:hypothetical protein